MKNFYEQEFQCEAAFKRLGPIFHLWTGEDFEIIFTCNDDFKAGMNIVGLCAILFPDLKILTFELMTNHVHFTLCGTEENAVAFFRAVKKHLSKYFRKRGRCIEWDRLVEHHRLLRSLNEARNVIVYNNRNGYLVNENHTPYTYPWGANRFYFNPELNNLTVLNSQNMPFDTRRKCFCSHAADKIHKVVTFDGYALPAIFCSIADGESLFSSASNYFFRISRSVESNKEIAKEIGESIYYTDDELYSQICKLCREKYSCAQPNQLPVSSKLEMAKLLRYEYNSSAKQIARILKLSINAIAALGI